MSWNAKYGLLIFASTAVTYLCALMIGRAGNLENETKARSLKRFILISSLVINIGLLAFFKYTGFFLDNINSVLGKTGLSLNIPKFDIVLPIGISFFIFQAVGYTIDVYRGETVPEKNPFRYALFVSFFPQLVAGPIERSKNLLMQLKEERAFDADNAREGLLTMALGIFMKMVVADNISAAIDPVYASPGEYSGMMILFSAILFSFQIYCDFGGYTLIAIGSARVLGIRLNPNFNAPYMGLSVGDFWKRWHISLTSWFRDYLYIPLGGNRKGKARKYLNTGIVFLLSGLWHGAAWHYVVWGAINGALCVTEDILKPVKDRFDKKLRIKTDDAFYRGIMRFLTFMLTTLTWIFFRAPSLGGAFEMIGKIVKDLRPSWFVNFEFTGMFESPTVMMGILVPVLIVIAFDMLKYKGKEAVQLILSRQAVIRWIIYICIVLMILYWGFYGKLYGQTQFIYFQF